MKKLDCLKRKSTWFAVISIILSISLIVGVTVSYLSAITEDKVNVFVPGDVSCDVVEVFSNNVKSSIKVQNTGNTDSYIRLNLVSYIQNDEGNIIGANAEVPYFEISGDWVLGADGYYYYKYPVKPGAFTGELLAEGETITLQYSEDKAQVIEVFAEAVQSNPSDAVLYAWGVEADSVVKSVSAIGVLDVQDGVYGKQSIAQYRGSNEIASNYSDGSMHWGDGPHVYTGSTAGIPAASKYFDAYHAGVLNDGIRPTVSSDDDTANIVEFWEGEVDYINSGSVTSDGYAFIYLKLNEAIDVKKVVVYTSNRDPDYSGFGRGYTNNIEVYVGNSENAVGSGNFLGSCSLSNSYIYPNSSDGMVKVYAIDTDRMYKALSGNFVILKIAMNNVLSFGEIEVYGYGQRGIQTVVQKNVALTAQYRGGQTTVCNTSATYTDESYRSGSTGNNWLTYHYGKLNDGKHSTAVNYFNNDWVEFGLSKNNAIEATDSGYYNIIFKLEQNSDVYTVNLYLHNSGNAARAYPTSVEVYLSDNDSWESTDYYFGKMTSKTTYNNYSQLFTISAAPTDAAYVVLRIYNSTAYKINAASEVEIWANVTENT